MLSPSKLRFERGAFGSVRHASVTLWMNIAHPRFQLIFGEKSLRRARGEDPYDIVGGGHFARCPQYFQRRKVGENENIQQVLEGKGREKGREGLGNGKGLNGEWHNDVRDR